MVQPFCAMPSILDFDLLPFSTPENNDSNDGHQRFSNGDRGVYPHRSCVKPICQGIRQWYLKKPESEQANNRWCARIPRTIERLIDDHAVRIKYVAE